MIYTYIWIAFLVELFVGILVGWTLATFYARRRESFESVWRNQDARDFAFATAGGSAFSGKVGIVQALSQDQSSDQMQMHLLEKSLDEAEMLREKANNELQITRESLSRSEVGLMNLETQVQSLRTQLSEEQSKNAATQAQVAYLQKSVADAQILAHTLTETKEDLYKQTLRLQTELDEAQKAREKLASQLAVYKEKMRLAISQLERTGTTK